MRRLLAEFKEFVNRGSLVDLAIAVLMATAFSPVVTAIVDGLVMNLVAAVFGQPDFTAIRIRIRSGGDDGLGTYLEVGALLTALINFLAVAVVCFFILKAYNRLRRTRAQAEAAAPPPSPSETDLLTEIRDLLRERR